MRQTRRSATPLAVNDAHLRTSVLPPRFEPPVRLCYGTTLLFCLGLLSACGGAAGGSGGVPTLTSINLSPSSVTLPNGTTQQMSATGIFSDGSSKDVTAQVTWASGNGSTATISASGLVTAVASGATSVSGSVGTVSETAAVTVAAAAVTAVAVAPTTANLPLGHTVQLVAAAAYSDGTTSDVTQQATWTSGTPANVTVSAAGMASSAVGAVAGGTSLLTAAYSGKSGSSTLTLTVACHNACSSAGATQCSGLQVQTCTADANGCLAWSAAATCGSGKSCFASTNSCQNDPCNGVPTTGICADSQTIELCSIPTGQGTPAVATYLCPLGSTCNTDTGSAACKNTGSCTPGATLCLDSTHLQTCNAGTPSTTACGNSCLPTALGSMCTSSLATTSVTFTVKYTLRGPNATYTDWSTTTTDVPVSSLLVLSYRGTNVLDAQTTDVNGSVTLLVPSAPQAGDIIVLTAAASDGASGLAFIVADPGFASPGTQPQPTVGTPKFWVWSAATSGVGNGSTLTVTENLGSGALRVFDYLRYVYYRSRAREGGKRGLSLIVWLGYGTSWSCGSCFMQKPTALSNIPFASQIFLDANTTDQRWWSDAVTAHELGHWVMASYGKPPGEGGRHVVGVPSYPGLTWSEGWATWHSSDARSSSIYFDKQAGAMMWWDIAADHYSDPFSPGLAWQLPTPAGGLLQVMDENEVSSMLWSISSNVSVGDQPLFTALSSTHMNASPWGRGYTRHYWTQLDPSTNLPMNVIDTGVPAPALPDFFDALDCAGVSRTAIDTATIPATQYPYPSAAPICP